MGGKISVEENEVDRTWLLKIECLNIFAIHTKQLRKIWNMLPLSASISSINV